MTGIITDIFDNDVPASNGRPLIKKKVAIITNKTNPEESHAIQFVGNLRRTLIRLFNINDEVSVEFKEKAYKSKKGMAFNDKKATSIKKV
jgi:hypothetical protein